MRQHHQPCHRSEHRCLEHGLHPRGELLGHEHLDEGRDALKRKPTENGKQCVGTQINQTRRVHPDGRAKYVSRFLGRAESSSYIRRQNDLIYFRTAEPRLKGSKVQKSSALCAEKVGGGSPASFSAFVLSVRCARSFREFFVATARKIATPLFTQARRARVLQRAR